MNVKINSTGGLSVGDATNGYKDLATKEYVDNKTFTVSWNDVSGKPTTFTPASHNHSAGDINSGTLDIARIPTGTSSTTVSLGNHTHSDYVATTGHQSVSGIKKFNTIYVGTNPLSSVSADITINPGFTTTIEGSNCWAQFSDNSNGYLYVFSDDCGTFYYQPANEAEYTLKLPKSSGTFATQQWVSGEHLSKNATTDQIVKSDLSLSGSITMANGKSLDLGHSSEESTKGYVHIESTNNTTVLPYIDIVKGGGQEFLELTSNSLLHTSNGGSSTLTLNFPAVTANVTKTIATTDHTHPSYALASAIAPAYDSTKTYSVGDAVTKNGSLWKCTTAVTTAEAFDSTKWQNVSLLREMLCDIVYPVGSIYTSVDSTSPAALFGGTWERITGRFLLAATDGGAAGGNGNASIAPGNTGGEAAHKLTNSELPKLSGSFQGANNIAVNFNSSTTNGYPTINAGSGIVSTSDVKADQVQVNAGSYTTKYNVTNTRKATISIGNDGSHNNMPPYLAVYVWKRTA